MNNLSVLDHFHAESVAKLLAEPWLPFRLTGRMTNYVGDTIARLIPTDVMERAEGLTRKFAESGRWIDPAPEAFDPAGVMSVIARADAVHLRNLAAIFAEGAVATAAISAVGVGGPWASIAAAMAEMPLSYTLVLQRSFAIQKAFHIEPTIERTNRAFSVAIATSRQQRYEACVGDGTSMMNGMFTRRMMGQPGRVVYASIRDSAPKVLSGAVARSATGEALDKTADQSARAVMMSGFTAYCKNHPQLVAFAMPIAGAVVGGSWSALSARGVMLASYHLSRLEYIEAARRRSGLPIAA